MVIRIMCSAWLLFAVPVFSTPPDFSGTQAFEYLEKQCEFGPRVPGSKGHAECLNYFLEFMKQRADTVFTQDFMFSFGKPQRTVRAVNVISRFQPQTSDRVLLCAHWDTRPWADSDPDPSNHDKPVLGANDGASGVAVLMHLAELLSDFPVAIGVDIVFFDAEDAGQHEDTESWARGSAAFAKTYANRFAPRYGILLDMIGDADLTVYQEQYSVKYAGFLVDRIWNKAAELGMSAFIPQPEYAVYDDHIPLLQAGIPCVDIIDFYYPQWHTVNDTPEYCSPYSLEQVGKVVTAILYEEY
ncbi:MAG: M28 family peptidase [candidate division KSB1 bacterium]|nr:M28 family peptidase [candidate division KSB1 bacterium]